MIVAVAKMPSPARHVRPGIAAADAFNQNPGVGIVDPTLHDLARAMTACFRDPRLANPLFVDHVASWTSECSLS